MFALYWKTFLDAFWSKRFTPHVPSSFLFFNWNTFRCKYREYPISCTLQVKTLSWKFGCLYIRHRFKNSWVRLWGSDLKTFEPSVSDVLLCTLYRQIKFNWFRKTSTFYNCILFLLFDVRSSHLTFMDKSHLRPRWQKTLYKFSCSHAQISAKFKCTNQSRCQMQNKLNAR